MQQSDCGSDLFGSGRGFGVINHMVLISDGSPLWLRNVHVIQFGSPHKDLSIQSEFMHAANCWNWQSWTLKKCAFLYDNKQKSTSVSAQFKKKKPLYYVTAITFLLKAIH